MKKQLRINATAHDIITSLIDYKLNGHKIPSYYLTKEVTLDNSTDKSKMLEMFKDCISYEIKDEYIEFLVPRTDKEKQKYFDDRKEDYEYNLSKLKNQMNIKQEWNEQITTYLKSKPELHWILEELSK